MLEVCQLLQLYIYTVLRICISRVTLNYMIGMIFYKWWGEQQSIQVDLDSIFDDLGQYTCLYND